MQKQNPLVYTVSLILLLGYGIYLFFRITLIPITHDEAGTILNFSTQPVWDIVTFKDPVPNNHIFHTLLVKALTTVFGYDEFICRLPNFIGGLIYWIFGFLLLRKINKGHLAWVLAGLVFLLGNPYLIEFFGLARGYGLSIAWMMVSIYLLMQGGHRYLYLSLLVAGLGVYTNLTTLNFFIPLCVLIFTMLLDQKETRKPGLIIPIVIFILVIASVGLPVSKMVSTDQFQFWGSNGFYSDTFLGLLRSSLMGKKYFGAATFEIFQALIIIVSLLVGYGTLRIVKRNRKKALHIPAFQLGFLFFATLIYNIAQNMIFKIPFLNARTALLFYPLFVLASYSMFLKLNKPVSWKISLIVPILGIALWHIKTCFNMNSTYEWWFDADNKKVMQAISAAPKPEKPNEKISLKCNWLFQPSLTYYTKIDYSEVVAEPPYNKSIDTSEIVDYYYITSEDRNDWFERNYSVYQAYAWDSRFLMKKNKPYQ